MITRKQYMAGEATFREYYGQFVTGAVRSAVKGRFGKALVTSEDPHFNDIPLSQWDSLACILGPNLIGPMRAATGQHPSAAELVCAVKEAAQQIREAETK